MTYKADSYEDARVVRIENAIAFVFRHEPGNFTVAIRGTDDPRDMSQNLMAGKLHKIKGVGRVHEGFFNHYSLLAPSILESLGDSPKSVCFTGHSLGGAVAMIAATVLPLPDDTDISCVTFGMPRIGDLAFVTAFEKRIDEIKRIRVADSRDPIVCLPPRVWCMSPYIHTVPCWSLSEQGLTVVSERERGHDGWRGKNIMEHFQANYLEDIERLLKGF
jgi:triacylglycerol lipase